MVNSSKKTRGSKALMAIAATLAASSSCTASADAAFASSTPLTPTQQRPQQRRARGGRFGLQMYVPSSSPTTQTSMMAAANMYPNLKHSASSSPSSLSNSDTLPSFRAAPGLLSPQTVMRLSEISDGSSDAVQYFLDTYNEYGPMACMPILSDPQVLPELTKAMRQAERH